MEEETLDIIQKIQEARSPKYFLWQILKETEWFASEKYDRILVGKYNDNIYFNYNIKKYILYYDFHKIYKILNIKYHLNELSVNELVSGMVSEHFKLKVDTTISSISRLITLVSKHFKLKVDTTECQGEGTIKVGERTFQIKGGHNRLLNS
jgi:hypothetical protein